MLYDLCGRGSQQLEHTSSSHNFAAPTIIGLRKIMAIVIPLTGPNSSSPTVYRLT